MKVIDVAWEGPFAVIYDRDEDFYNPPIRKDLLNSAGVYQIYGDHTVYGRGVLLYIGQAQNFGQRLKTHFNDRFFYHVEMKVYLGIIKHKEMVVSDTPTIKAVESLLIAANKPALNGQLLDYASDTAKNILVRNWDFIGSIVPECSGGYWCA